MRAVLSTDRWDSAIELFARTTAIDYERVLIAMLTVCFDAAGKETTTTDRVVVVGGFAGFANTWSAFSNAWGACLTEAGVTCFHAQEFAQSSGEYSGWKGKEEKRRKFLRALMATIQEHGLRKFGCIVNLDDFRSVALPIQFQSGQTPIVDAFAYGAVRAVEQFHDWAREIGVTKNVEHIFEKGDPESALRSVFAKNGLEEPNFRRKRPYTDRKGFDHDPFVGLQTADWIAYEYYLDANRRFSGDYNERWALNQFYAMPSEIKIAQKP